MQREVEERQDQETAAAADRLDSWKELAAYLKRSVSTVQRWEREGGLPVYRRNGENGKKHHGQVFAYKSDLDTWWEGFRTRPGADEPWWAGWRQNRWVYVAAGALVVVLAAGISLWRSRRGSPLFGEEQVAAWRFRHGEASPDGRWFAYREPESGHLWLRDLSSQNRGLLIGEWVHEHIAWSPDSTRIAFAGLGSAPARLEIVNIRNGIRRVVQAAAEAEMPPLPFDWTPDGKALLCLRRPQLIFLPLEGAQPRGQQAALEWRGRERARISPDGRFLAYESGSESGSDIFVRPVDGRPEVRVTDHPARELLPFWSPDGRLLYFGRMSRFVETALWAAEIDPATGAARREFEVTTSKPASLVVTPTVVVGGDLLGVRFARDGAQTFLLEVDARSGRPKGPPKSTFSEYSFALAWSGDGAKLYYRDVRAGFSYPPAWRGKVFVERDLHTGRDRVIALQPPDATRENFYWEAFHPESQRLSWSAQNGNWLYWHDRATGEAGQAEFAEHTVEAGLAWSPDARRILFAGRRRVTGAHDLAVLHLKDKRVEVLASGRWVLQGAWSSDGQQIAYTDANCLKVIAAAGGPARDVVCAGAASLPEPGKFPGQLVNYLWINAIQPSWSPDGKWLAWTVPVPEKKRVELWIVDAESGEKEVAFAGETDYYSVPRNPRWSPSGRHIAFSMNWYDDRQVWKLRGLRSAPGIAGL